jgi:amidase
MQSFYKRERESMEQTQAGNPMKSLLRRPAHELAEMVRSGEISARELTEAALRQIEADRDLNAFTLVDADAALAAADAIKPGDPRPFAGVPTAIKELHAVAGQQFTMGSNIYGEYGTTYDSYVARRIRDAGFISVGRTSAPEFGIVPVTSPKRFGHTRNPWDPNRTPGGSSGGAAAAVAGGSLPIAHATDGAGSIRIPAAACGLVGLKPSRGRVSFGPDAGDNLLSVQNCVSHTVADSARFLDILAGYEPGDATWAPSPEEPFAVSAARDPGKLRIAMNTTSPLATEVDPICAQAVTDAGKLLESLGHHVEEVTPPDWVAPQLIQPFLVVWGAGIASGVQFGAQVTKRRPTRELVESVTWMFCEMGLARTSADLVTAIAQLQGYARRLVAFLSQWDVFLTPVLAQRPLPIGYLDTDGADPQAEFRKAVEYAPFTAHWNLTGQPAISLPLYQGQDGLPLAIQLVGQPLGEGTLLSLATQLEQAQPWADRVPPMRG